jgi:enoyl-CoA hydratase
MSLPTSSDVLLYEVTDRIATLTMNRPDARNALNAALRQALMTALLAAEQDDGVDVVVLTGSDPAFCAGLDLKELGSAPQTDLARDPVVTRPFPPMTKPLIGAINGVAVTGGFELALNCSFLIASERARFADTHARVGIQPGWGLTVLLSQAVGVRKARELSLTGNYLTADDALTLGLVNHVVPHGELLATCHRFAADVVGNDQEAVRQLLATYEGVAATTVAEGWEVEAAACAAWQQRRFDPAEVERRRQGIMDRGRAQIHG